jgi:protein-S-isoprenylcysteine O-methyltransferase Ste14
MGTLGYLTIALSVVWLATEARINAAKRPGATASVDDRSSYLIFHVSTFAAVGIGLAVKLLAVFVGGAGQILFVSPYLGYFGCLVMVGGMALRWAAIATLNKQFTVKVAIVEGHRIIDTGLYRLVRHPSYLGGLITFIGLGLAWENWICLLIILAVRLPATYYRISVEEKVLVAHFGEEYSAYRNRTKGLIPGII